MKFHNIKKSDFFSIEVRLCGVAPDGSFFGGMAFRALDEQIGNIEIDDSLGIPVAGFDHQFRETSQSFTDSIFISGSPEAILNEVYQALYIDHGEDLDVLQDLTKKYGHYEILPGGSGPWFDGWYAVLVHNDKEDRFIWKRKNDQAVKQVKLKAGEFRAVIDDFINWYSQELRSRHNSNIV